MAITCNGKLQTQYNSVSAAARSAAHHRVFFFIIIIVIKCKVSFKQGCKSLSDTEICAPMSFLLTAVCCHGNRRRRLVSKQVTFTKETSTCAVGPASIFWSLGAHQDLSFTRRNGISHAVVRAVRWELDSDVCAHPRFIVSNWCCPHASSVWSSQNAIWMMAGGQFFFNFFYYYYH